MSLTWRNKMIQEKKYTLKQCKRDMISMWSWLAKTGKCSKQYYINFIQNYRAKSTYERFIDMNFTCPCCTYSGHDNDFNSNKHCKKCPIKWENKYLIGKDPQCVILGSAYYNWQTSTDEKDHKKYATIILSLSKNIKVK